MQILAQPLSLRLQAGDPTLELGTLLQQLIALHQRMVATRLRLLKLTTQRGQLGLQGKALLLLQLRLMAQALNVLLAQMVVLLQSLGSGALLRALLLQALVLLQKAVVLLLPAGGLGGLNRQLRHLLGLGQQPAITLRLKLGLAQCKGLALCAQLLKLLCGAGQLQLQTPPFRVELQSNVTAPPVTGLRLRPGRQETGGEPLRQGAAGHLLP